ncbi:MAG: hypothetical protein AAB573_01160 [Patescibacteria group bacterium]
MKDGDAFELAAEADHELEAQRAPVRVLESVSALPAWVRSLLGEKEEKRDQAEEIESTALLDGSEHRERIIKQLTDDGASEIMHAELEAQSYEFKDVCVLVDESNKQACARMTARIRVHTHRRSRGWRGWIGLSKEGLIEHFWTVKLRLNDNDEYVRLEFEGPAMNKKEALELLTKKVQELLKLKILPKFDESSISFRVTKTRHSLKYLKNVEPPRPCTGSRVDIDTITAINGKKLKTPLVTVDVEGPSVQAIAECRNCLNLAADEFHLRDWMRENGM